MREEFKKIISSLNNGIKKGLIEDFTLIGALALSSFSEPRATADMDFLVILKEGVTPVGLTEWLRIVRGHNRAKLCKGKKVNRIKNLIEIPIGNTWADVIVSEGKFEKEVVKNSIRIRIFGLNVKVANPEYQIVMKLKAGSPQDILDASSLYRCGVNKRVLKTLISENFLESKFEKMIKRSL
ncbi:MAG: hypothetical protein AB1393_14765 [Candidatus Edwardsbacteria bacterium]